MPKIKCILLGEAGVGKTSIIKSFSENYFSEYYLPTKTPIKIKSNNFLIYDTPGMNEYKAVNKVYMKNTKIVILVYDMTNKETFIKLKRWYYFVCKINDKKNIDFYIIANKSDLFIDQQVTYDEGEYYSLSIGGIFYETTATNYKTNKDLFNEIFKNYKIEGNKIKKVNTINQLMDLSNKFITKKYDNGTYTGILLKEKRNIIGKMEYNNGDIYEGN